LRALSRAAAIVARGPSVPAGFGSSSRPLHASLPSVATHSTTVWGCAFAAGIAKHTPAQAIAVRQSGTDNFMVSVPSSGFWETVFGRS